MKLAGFASRFKARGAAFTLIELLVSMAVLAMLMGILLQVVNGILQSTQLYSRQMDSVGAARRAMDTLSLDISRAVVGEYSAILMGPNKLAMVTDRRGTNSSDHRFLGVTYSVNTSNQIVRTYRSVSFNETDLLAAAQETSGATMSPLANGILGWSIRAMTSSGPHASTNSTTPNYATNIYNGFTVPLDWNALITASPAFASPLANRSQGLDVWIAAVDEQNEDLLQDTSKLDDILQALRVDPTHWRSAIDEADIPAPAKASIQILHQTIPIP